MGQAENALLDTLKPVVAAIRLTERALTKHKIDIPDNLMLGATVAKRAISNAMSHRDPSLVRIAVTVTFTYADSLSNFARETAAKLSLEIPAADTTKEPPVDNRMDTPTDGTPLPPA